MSYDYSKLLNYAQQNIGKINVGEEFTIKNILGDIEEYTNLIISDKMSFGKSFKNDVKMNKIPNIVIEERKKNNSQVYRKIG